MLAGKKKEEKERKWERMNTWKKHTQKICKPRHAHWRNLQEQRVRRGKGRKGLQRRLGRNGPGESVAAAAAAETVMTGSWGRNNNTSRNDLGAGREGQARFERTCKPSCPLSRGSEILLQTKSGNGECMARQTFQIKQTTYFFFSFLNWNGTWKKNRKKTRK